MAVYIKAGLKPIMSPKREFRPRMAKRRTHDIRRDFSHVEGMMNTPDYGNPSPEFTAFASCEVFGRFSVVNRVLATGTGVPYRPQTSPKMSRDVGTYRHISRSYQGTGRRCSLSPGRVHRSQWHLPIFPSGSQAPVQAMRGRA